MAKPYGPPMPDRRSTSTAWATALGYCAMSSPKVSGAWEVDSVMPRMPASAYPWKTAAFSASAIWRDCFVELGQLDVVCAPLRVVELFARNAERRSQLHQGQHAPADG